MPRKVSLAGGGAGEAWGKLLLYDKDFRNGCDLVVGNGCGSLTPNGPMDSVTLLLLISPHPSRNRSILAAPSSPSSSTSQKISQVDRNVTNEGKREEGL